MNVNENENENENDDGLKEDAKRHLGGDCENEPREVRWRTVAERTASISTSCSEIDKAPGLNNTAIPAKSRISKGHKRLSTTANATTSAAV